MKLLVSVTSLEEAREAITGGADILDVKNPAEGSLGAHFPRVIQGVRAMAPRSLPVSAAIGDMPNLPGTAALAALGAATCGADYIKVGLWGPRTEAEAVALLQEVQRAVSAFPDVAVIAAGYADAQRVLGPQSKPIGLLSPLSLPRIAQAAGVTGCMFDTAIKDGRRLFDFLLPEALEALAAEAHARHLLFAVAGSLHEQDLPMVRDLGADVAGVRSAVCQDGHRAGPLDVELVRRLQAVIALPVQDDPSRE
jgi:uncharacterized protein (UPF0264 family)